MSESKINNLEWKDEYHHLKLFDIDKEGRFVLRLRCSIHPEDPQHRVFIRAINFLDNKNKIPLIEMKPLCKDKQNLFIFR